MRRHAVALSGMGALAYSTGTARSAALSLALQALVFLAHAYPNDSEKYYDASGALTHLALVIDSLLRAERRSGRKLVNSILAIVWATRLGSFLYLRILRDGADGRFDLIKAKGFAAFSFAWLMQALWCYLVEIGVLMGNKDEGAEDATKDELTYRDALGWTISIAGLVLEVVADSQKNAFHNSKRSEGLGFIREGLWAYSRHPNYLGEMMMWSGIAVSASQNWGGRLHGLISPLFTIFLLTKVSGIPMVEKRAMERFGSLPEYQEYLRATPVLVPSPFR